MMTTLQKWLLAMAGLGALYLTVTHPEGIYKAGQAVSTAVGGTETSIITGGQK